REIHRDQRGVPFIDSLLQDLRYAIRQMRRSPGFTASAVLILALGCGATTAIFSVAYGVLLRELPYDEPDRLVTISATLRPAGLAKANAGAADYFDWRARQQVFDDLALTRPVANFNLTGSGEPERLQGARTTASLFPTLGVTPLLGRVFTEQEQLDPGLASRVAVLSYGLWQRRFAGDPSIVGRTIELNGTNTTVLGVMRPEFRYPSRDFELWTPLYVPPNVLRQRFDYSYLSVARLRPRVKLEQARTHMEAIAADLARAHPRSNTGVGVYLEPMLGGLTGEVRPALRVMLLAVGTLFLVACVNLANLLVARATRRAKEFSVRMALGASRGRLARQFFIEVLPLAALGGTLGVLAAAWILQFLIPLLPATMPRVEEIGLHGPVLAISVLLAIAAAAFISMAPAMQANANVARGPSRHSRLGDGLIVTEIAGTVVLLVCAGLLIRSFTALRATDPGFNPQGVLGLHIAVNRKTHGVSDAGVARYLARILERVQTVPGVRSAGIVNRLPMGGQTQILAVAFEGHQDSVTIDSRSVGGNYFQALGIPLIAGRAFDERDTADASPAGIIDEHISRMVFGDADPIGKRFRIPLQIPGVTFPWIEVVGVVGHLRHEGLDRDPRPQVYWPYQQRTQDRMALVVKTSGDPAGFAGAVRAAIHEIDPDQPLYDVLPMTEFVARTMAGDRLNTVLVGSFASLALLLASVGVYGVVSQITARRARDFGIRLALGADPRDIMSMVLIHGLARAVCGLILGLTAAAAVTRLLSSMLNGVLPLDAVTYLAVALVLTLAVLVASYLPARRAAGLDPITTLRQE
ncbi:MAG: ABC transporter permease, partial [Acidobacteria bacterium]|nr:ABC transporter permease [Acidobacteriota bacterium]